MKMNRLVLTLTAALGIVAASGHARADDHNWPHWRGPAFDGSGEAVNLPDKLDPAAAAWTADLPGPGAGTPILWGERVFVSALDARSKKLLAICLNRKDGKVLWQKDVGLGFQSNDRNNMAAPSPLTDGKLVWFYYGTGDLACFDLGGNPKWSRNLVKDHGSFNFMWIYGSSPTLYNGKLYVQVLHRDSPYGSVGQGVKAAKESYLLALDPQTGQDLWKQVRPDEAREESKESYASPIPWESGGRKEVVLIGGDAVTGHDAETGRELWRFGGWNPQKIGHWRIVPSVVTGAGQVYACAPKGGDVYAIKAGGAGDVTASHLAWKSGGAFSSDVCVPLFYKGSLYVLDGDKKKLSCVDPATGKVKWSGDLGGGAVFRASPTGADGKIYCMNEAGAVWVLSADEFKVLHKAELGGANGPSRASVAVSDGHAFVRTSDKLYCFGAKK